MHYFCSFSVGMAHDRHRPGDITLDDMKAFNVVARSGEGVNLVNPLVCNVRCSWGNEQLREIFDLLSREAGQKPVADAHFASGNKDRYYNVQVERMADPEELNNARWLYLTPPKGVLAEFKAVDADDRYVVTKTTSKKKIAFGCTRTVGWMMLFSEGLKEKFLSSGLRGVNFETVRLENGAPSGLLQLASPVRMPPLAMRLTDGQGNPYLGQAAGQACCAYEGSYFPQVFRYRESEMAGLPAVDVIQSAERLGWGGHNMHRMHIVSQHFRQVAEKLAPGQFSYGLVAVGEGEELQTRFTIPELAPPRDML